MYDFVKVFEDNWKIIYHEYLQVESQLDEYYEKHIYNHGWETFCLFRFPTGIEHPPNTAKCPVTTNLVKNNFPHGVGTVAFSRLAPGTILEPHTGFKGNFLRAHLGLKVPVGDIGLQVEDTVITWEQGKMIIFDDRKIHSAWNKTDQERVVLLIDFVEY